MAFCVFLHRPDSVYDDNPAVQYQFPKLYLDRAKACVGDWVIYLEPVKLRGSRGYFGVAKVQRIIPDPKAADMYLALIEPGSYLDFAEPVPFRDREGPMERSQLNQNGINTRSQWSVRPISPADFDRILAAGLADREPLLPRTDLPQNFAEESQTPFVIEQSRDRVQQLTNRVVRDRIFRRVVLRAYDERCAITGLKLINGGGRAEVNAAHIRPVEKDGPDIVTNGIALSGTAHWMFDRGLISLDNDLGILISRHANDVDGLRAFVRGSGQALPPLNPKDRPHPRFLAWHRDCVFKQ